MLVELNEISGRSESSSALRMRELVESYWIARGVRLAIRLDLPEMLAQRSRSIGELAAMTGAEEMKLSRLMRGLTAAGIFQEVRRGHYATTPLARSLEARAASSMRDFFLDELGEQRESSWDRFEDELVRP